MNELSLFSGAGGGLLGSKLLGHRIIGYVENEIYCQKILHQRIADGILDAAPIFGDIRKFISEGYAEAYQGMVDIVTAGFPCQPFSVANPKRKGESDKRNMWPATMQCLRIIRPRFAFLENVPGLLSSGYFGRVLGDLATGGWNARWCVLGARDIGANHVRKRLWVLAYPRSKKSGRIPDFWWKEMAEVGNVCEISDRNSNGGNGNQRPFSEMAQRQNTEPPGVCSDVADTNYEGLQKSTRGKLNGFHEPHDSFTRCKSCGRITETGNWWSTEPDVGRVAHGVAHRVDRLKAIGNGQVPLQMAYAFSILSQEIVEATECGERV